MIQAFFLFYSDPSSLSPVPESWLQKLKNFFSMMQMLTSPIVQILIKYLRKHFVLTRYDKNRIISKTFLYLCCLLKWRRLWFGPGSWFENFFLHRTRSSLDGWWRPGQAEFFILDCWLTLVRTWQWMKSSWWWSWRNRTCWWRWRSCNRWRCFNFRNWTFLKSVTAAYWAAAPKYNYEGCFLVKV